MQDLSNESLRGSAPSRESRSVPPSISVVVPTRNRPLSLQRCLDALARQSCLEALEVIVVDDGSAEPEAVADVVRAHAFARLIRQRPSGPARARNAGVAVALGECVCFTDDDCEPGIVWAERLAAAIHAGADVVAGSTSTGEPGSAFAAASEVIVSAPSSLSTGELSFAPTNNVASRREVLLALPFDDSFPEAAGEDRDWCARLVAAGYVLQTEPAATLVHRPAVTFRSFLRQQVRYGRGAFWFRRGGHARRPLERPTFYVGLLRSGFRRGLGAGLLVTAAQAATAFGFLLARVAARRD
jgi:glycosyltransferase involved in cell wall biosynthesis